MRIDCVVSFRARSFRFGLAERLRRAAWRRAFGPGVLFASLSLCGGIAMAQIPVPGVDSSPPQPPATPPPAKPTDSIPGSPKPPGLGLDPEAPPVTPAPGGAPSFGAPDSSGSEWSFRISGRFQGQESVGIGGRPDPVPPGYSGGTVLHVPALIQGRQPFFQGAGASLTFDFGNAVINATVRLDANFSGKEYQGYYNPVNGPAIGQAYLTITPPPLGPVRLQLRVGGFTEVYGGPGQWGWGIYGPMIGIRGYGERATGEFDLSPDLRLSLSHGIMAVPGVPEAWVRGDYHPWIETGVSAWVNHAHAVMTIKNQYTLGLHYATAYGPDERKYLRNLLGQPFNPSDPRENGRMDVLVLETRWMADPWGQIGLSLGFWNFDHAASVGNGIWWGLDWTQGAREMLYKFIATPSIPPALNADGTYSLDSNTGFPTNPGRKFGTGTGKLAAASFEWATSLARILWYPRNFDGRGPDVRLQLAGILYRTLQTDDPFLHDASGYNAGTEIEYRATSWFSVIFLSYLERRWTWNQRLGEGIVYSASPGIALHSDWLSLDRITLAYTWRWYNDVVDSNPAAPLDRHVLTLGGYMSF
jgi:hypothetical protein